MTSIEQHTAGLHNDITVCCATYGRPDAVIRMCESALSRLDPLEIIIVIDSCSATSARKHEIASLSDNIRILENQVNLGPGKSKHVAIQAATTDTCIVLDDDAVVLDYWDWSRVDSLLSRYSLIQGGIFADYSKTTMRSNEYPSLFKWPKLRKFDISYFVGAIHILNRSDYLSSGGYTDIEGYGFEELALSIRLLRIGKRMTYDASFSIAHLRDPRGRKAPLEVSRIMLRNRILISEKFFPPLLCWIQKTLWKLRHAFRFRELFSDTVLVDRKEVLTAREILRNPRLLARSIW